MHSNRRVGVVLALLALVLNSACHSRGSSGDGSSGDGSSETVQATPSVSGTVTAVSGASQILSIPFNASESSSLLNLTMTSGLAPLPAGWSGPATFTCATVSSGNGCVLSLTYAPTGAAAGTLALEYTYTDSSGGSHTGSISVPYASTTDNNVMGTASPIGQIVAMASSGSQSVAVTFDTDDGNPATSLALTTDLTSLPSGWSSTVTTFTCASVSTGNGCQLPLTFAPTAAGSGTLALMFSYKDDSGTAKTGTVSIPYSSTSNNNVVATSSPSGQVNAVLAAGTQVVTVTFTTDDGNPASGLALTSSLGALPTGWSSVGSSFNCATVSTGSGCQLALSYAPVAVGSGAVQLTYSYTNNAGTAKTGTVNIPYAATSHDNVAGTVSPTGQITAVVNSGNQAVHVTFATDDGNVATALAVTTAFNTLPAGWSASGQSFSCANVSTGTSCQLTLAYAPTTASSGTLSLQFGYTDNAGTLKTGTVNISYTGTTHDNVVGMVSPVGTVSGLVGSSQNVTVSFTTDDGNSATGLAIASAVISSLPAGWSSGVASLACASVSTGTGCQLGLVYAPSAVASGSLSLGYSYTDNAGSAKTGTVSIPYAATVHNNVVATLSPSSSFSTYVGTPQTVTVTFNTDDANTASSLSVTSGLASLPTDWSSASGTFSCSTVSATGSACQLVITFTPTAVESGNVAIAFSYSDNSGTVKTGSVSVVYAATAAPHAYVVDDSGGVYLCTIASDGTLPSCTLTLSVFGLTGIVMNGSFAYVANFDNNDIQVCSVGTGGALSNCQSTGSDFNSPTQLAIRGSYFYAANANGSTNVTVCSIDSNTGSLSGCTAADGFGDRTRGVTFGPTYGYVADFSNGIEVCSVGNTGLLTSCTPTAGSSSWTVWINSSYAYFPHNSSVNVCAVANDGTLSNCVDSLVATGVHAKSVSTMGGFAYVSVDGAAMFSSDDLYVCSINSSDGSLTNCVVSDGGESFGNLYNVAFQ